MLYPQVGLWADGSHHNLVFNFFGHAARPELVAEDSAAQFARIAALAAADDRDLLISSESLAGLDVGAFIRALLGHLGQGWAPQILFACREHFEWVASLYNQSVKDPVLREQQRPGAYLRASARRFCIMPMLERLSATGFPVRVVSYHPAADFVPRFLRAIGIGEAEQLPVERRNISLGVVGLVAMLAVKQVLAEPEEIERHLRALRGMKGLFASAPLIFDHESMAAVEPIFAEDRTRLAQAHGVLLPTVELATREDQFFLTQSDFDQLTSRFAPLGPQAEAISLALLSFVRA